MPDQPHANLLTDLQGAVQLATDSTLGITDIVEAMHGTIQRVPLPVGKATTTRTRGITGLVYGTIRTSTRMVGGALGLALGPFSRMLPPSQGGTGRQRALAILNGVGGDHLERTENPLRIRMHLRAGGRLVNPACPQDVLGPAPGRRPILMIHGLCLSDLCWNRGNRDHESILADELGHTVLHVNYNTGLSITENGLTLAALIEDLLAGWPEPIEGIDIVAHSMGGLVTRSACHHAVTSNLAWANQVRRLVFLGTPHAGAPLERVGGWVDRLIEISPYSAPLSRLGRARSQGITDLRHGRVVAEADAAPMLPPQVVCHVVAATLGDPGAPFGDRVVGDGLVPLDSALGRHPDERHALEVADHRQLVLSQTGHLDLLSSPEVQQALLQWLGEHQDTPTDQAAAT